MMRYDPDVVRSSLLVGVSDVSMIYSAAICLASSGQYPAQLFNDVRDAKHRCMRSHGNCKTATADGWAPSIERTAIAELNRSVKSGPDLSIALSALSTKSPFTVVSCVLNAAIRHRPDTDGRTTLRSVLGSLGNCSRLALATPDGETVSVAVAWLYSELTVPRARRLRLCDIIQFATSTLFVPLQSELSPPLDAQTCLEFIVPRMLTAPCDQVTGICLARACVESLTNTETHLCASSGIRQLVFALNGLLRFSDRTSASSRNHTGDILAVLEGIFSLFSCDVRKNIWEAASQHRKFMALLWR
jgi:hypothetical protein